MSDIFGVLRRSLEEALAEANSVMPGNSAIQSRIKQALSQVDKAKVPEDGAVQANTGSPE